MSGSAVQFGALDWVVVAMYFVILAGIALWVALKREKTTTDYFLASRNAGWFLIGTSIFASNIGAEHLVGLAGSGAGSGMAYAHWELHSYLCIVLGWIFAPFYLRSNVFTTPEFLEKRYTPATRTTLSLIFLVSYILTKASVTIYAGAITIKTILGFDTVSLPGIGDVDFFWVSAFALVVITGLYTIVGGMKAVLWTEGVQAPLLLIGSVIILIVGLDRVGGMDALRAANADTISMWRPLSTTAETQGFPNFLFDPSDTPWLGVMLASPILGLWYWCTDQYIVQRILAAKNLTEARRGAIFAGYLKLFPVFIFLIPGMIAVTLQQQGAPGFAEMTSPDQAFPLLASYLLPEGLRGLVLAGMLAALMSSLASLFNSTATLFTVDFYKRVRPQSSEAHLVMVGRVATLVVVGLGIAWIPILLEISDGQLYAALQLVQALIAPAIAAVFVLGIASKFVSPISGLVGLITGFAVGMTRLFLQTSHDFNGVTYPGPVQAFVDINWLYFAFLLFAFTCLVILVVSTFTPKADPAKIVGLTRDTVTDAQRAEVKASYGAWDIFHSFAILAIIAGVYITFW
ncbi:MAG: sodium:solute symporter [Hyphomonadaceae bacterium]|nr:sodium:solute symporter [Hyphomonadaceae bacterium]